MESHWKRRTALPRLRITGRRNNGAHARGCGVGDFLYESKIRMYEKHCNHLHVCTCPQCQGTICASITIVDKDGREFPPIKPLCFPGNPMRFKWKLRPPTNGIPISSANTLTGFYGCALHYSFTKAENGIWPSSDAGRRIRLFLLLYSEPHCWSPRLHFVPQEADRSYPLAAFFRKRELTHDLPLTIVEPQLLEVSVLSSVEGEPIFYRENSTGAPITNALIRLTDAAGKFSGSVQGRNLSAQGEWYVFKNTRCGNLRL